MSALVCLSAALLDQSFPRSDEELRVVRDALGEIQHCVEEGNFGLIMTEYLRHIANPVSFNYDRYDECPFLRDILHLIRIWVLQEHERIERLDLSQVRESQYEPHPPPRGSEDKGLVEFWQDEVGKLLYAHDTICKPSEFFVGVASDSGFAGQEPGEYDNPSNRRCFPLVGSDEVMALSDAYEWVVPEGIWNRHVGLDDFWRNCEHIGAVSIVSPTRGSHHTVEFENGNSWPLDTNDDPIPPHHLDTLSSAAGYPKDVLKDSLINGRDPRLICRLHEFQT